MTDFYRNKSGNKVLAIEQDVVEEYTMLSTKDARIVVGWDFAKEDARETVVAFAGEPLKEGQLVVEKEPEEETEEEEGEEVEEISPLNRPLKHTITPTVDDPVEERREKNKQLQQRFGNTCINAIVRMREEGASLEDIIEKRPFGTRGMLVADIEEIMDNWTELDN